MRSNTDESPTNAVGGAIWGLMSRRSPHIRQGVLNHSEARLKGPVYAHIMAGVLVELISHQQSCTHPSIHGAPATISTAPYSVAPFEQEAVVWPGSQNSLNNTLACIVMVHHLIQLAIWPTPTFRYTLR